jgi:hypothetical protein
MLADVLGDMLKAAINTLKTLVDDKPKPLSHDEPKSPLHVGEVMDCWTYLIILQEAIDFAKVGINTTMDDEVRNMLREAIDMCESQVARLKDFMRNEGIPLPSLSPPKPKSEPDAVPLGVKMADGELANSIALKVSGAVLSATAAATKSIRRDVAMMWVQFQSEQMTFGGTLKAMMRRRGWIKIPPSYYPPGLPN